MEIKTNESISLETRNSLKKQTVESVFLRIVLVLMIAITVIFAYGRFENARLHLICSKVECLSSTSTAITVSEYNNLVDKINSEGYTISYTVENNSKVISEKSGKVDSDVPLASGDRLILTFTNKVDGDSTGVIVFKEYLVANIEY